MIQRLAEYPLVSSNCGEMEMRLVMHSFERLFGHGHITKK